MGWIRRCLIATCLVGVPAGAADAEDAALVNVTPGNIPALVAVAKAAGLKPQAARADATDFSEEILVWEARRDPGEITPEAAARIGAWVGKGGRLLVTMSENPGLGPMRLAFMLPTTAWQTQDRGFDAAHNAHDASITAADSEMFPSGPVLSQLALPYLFSLRPFHAVERGEGRYERFDRLIPYLEVPARAGETFWTRPLINRDWRVRAWAGDLAHTPVLLTGRYGAGRVAVFASSAAVKGPGAQPLWQGVLRWLLTDDPAVGHPLKVPLPAPTWDVDAEHHQLRVTVNNPQATPIQLRVVARLRTWERAMVGDVEQSLVVPAKGSAIAKLPLPKPGPEGYQALDYQDAFDIRLGILTADGATLMHELRARADLRPAMLVSVATDNLRAVEYPFKAPGPLSPFFPARMGMEVDAYAYAPGQTVNARVKLANGVRNIAPLAEAMDESHPNNASAMGLNDDAGKAEQGAGTDKIEAYSCWIGEANRENILRFTFPSPVTVAGVTLVGIADNYRHHATRGPGAVAIEADGQEVARAEDLDKRLQSEFGAVRLPFPPRQATVIRVRLPWVPKPVPVPNGTMKREAPWLAEVQIEGSTGPLPGAQAGTLSLALRDAMSGEAKSIGQQEITVPPGAVQSVSFPVPMPKGDAPRFYHIEASFAGQAAVAPFMTLAPTRPLLSVLDVVPPNAPSLGFIVTRGFRNVFDTGTGTAELIGGWGQPDDLVWAYSHQMKQLGKNSRTHANRLYLSESDMAHYSTPWRCFPDGAYFYDVAADLLVARMKEDRNWANSTVVNLGHSDRWDTGPDVGSLHGWQDFVDFDQSLRGAGEAGLHGRTREELAAEIHQKYEHRWQAWQLERYAHAVRELTEAFAREGKRLVITAQGTPLVPAKDEAIFTATIRGQSDDSTWAMLQESVPWTTGRQMGCMAFNPSWEMSTLLLWGYNSSVLNNPHWHNAVGTTEPSRRHLYDRAWRGIIGRDGAYRSMHTYGYNDNAGVAYTMTQNDWQEWWRVQERNSLIAPDGPIGAGIVISTARFADPAHASFSGSGGGGGSGEADEQVRAVANAVRRLEDAGVSAPFSANAGLLDHWPANAPMVLLDVDLFSKEELAALRKLQTAGVRMAAFTSKGATSLPAEVAALFGARPGSLVSPGGRPGDAVARPPVTTAKTLFAATPFEELSATAAQALAPWFQKVLDLPIEFPPGTGGYGFTSQGVRFIVVEDWMEQGRTVAVKLCAGTGATAAKAVDVNDHRSLTMRREGKDWVITLPLRPADGVLIAIEETKR